MSLFTIKLPFSPINLYVNIHLLTCRECNSLHKKIHEAVMKYLLKGDNSDLILSSFSGVRPKLCGQDFRCLVANVNKFSFPLVFPGKCVVKLYYWRLFVFGLVALHIREGNDELVHNQLDLSLQDVTIHSCGFGPWPWDGARAQVAKSQKVCRCTPNVVQAHCLP